MRNFNWFSSLRIGGRVAGMRDCFLDDSDLMLVIELVSKWEICWVLWSLVLFDPV